MNSYCLSFKGKFELPNALSIGKTYNVYSQSVITGKSEDDNHDGTHTETFKAESMLGIEVKNPEGQRIYAKPKKGQSKQLRFMLMNMYDEDTKLQEQFKEFNTFYEWYYGKIKHNIRGIMEMSE